jgi:hypothetical protein
MLAKTYAKRYAMKMRYIVVVVLSCLPGALVPIGNAQAEKRKRGL